MKTIYRILASAVLAATVARPALAQGEAIPIAATLAGGWVVLSGASLYRFFRGSVDAHPGDSVRVSRHDDKAGWTEAGRLESLHADSVAFVTSTGKRFAYATGGVDEVRVFGGREHAWAQGWLIGGIAGAAVGSFASICDDGVTGCTPAPVVGAILVGALGSEIGAGIGALIEKDAWRSVKTPLPVSVGIAPTARGLAIGMNVRF